MQDDQIDIIAALIYAITCALVDDLAAVEAIAEPLDTGYVVRIRTAPEDVGKVIGKQGRTARSIRTLVSAACMKYGIRVSVDIIENHNHQPVTAA